MGKLGLTYCEHLRGEETCFSNVVLGEEHERCHGSKTKSRKFRVEQFQKLAMNAHGRRNARKSHPVCKFLRESSQISAQNACPLCNFVVRS